MLLSDGGWVHQGPPYTHPRTHPTAQGEKVEANARFLGTAQWCDEVASTITLLGGLSLLHVSPDAVHLKLVTAYPGGPVRGPDPGPCATADHELSVHLRPGSSTGAQGGARGGGWAGAAVWRVHATCRALPGRAHRCPVHALAMPAPARCLAVSSAQLTPADVEVADIVEAARDGSHRIDFVVCEVQARLGAWLHR